MGTSAANESLNFFLIVIHDLWPTYSFLFPFPYYSFGNGQLHYTDLLNDLLKRYYTIILTQYMIQLAKNLNFCAN